MEISGKDQAESKNNPMGTEIDELDKSKIAIMRALLQRETLNKYQVRLFFLYILHIYVCVSPKG